MRRASNGFIYLFFPLNLKAPKHTLPPQTPTRTALAHSTRTKSTDPVYGSVSLSATGDRSGAERWIYLFILNYCAMPRSAAAGKPGASRTHTHPANTHTHRTSTQHTHKKNRPSLWVCITIRYRRPLRCRALDCPGSAAGVERQAEHARILAADDSRDVALVAEPVIDDGPA